nr:hypothetical protein [Tanacetum cinerariifolium]
MLLCKQAEQGVPLQAEQYDWLADTDEEVDEQELEAHYSYMAKIQEVPTADSGTDSEPVEQTKQAEFEKFKAFNDRTIDYDKLKHLFRAPTPQDIEKLIQTCLMPLAMKTQSDSLKFVHELKQEMHADLKYVESLEKEIDELESKKAEFSDMLSKQTEFVSKKVHTELLQRFAKVEKHSISLKIALQNCKEQVVKPKPALPKSKPSHVKPKAKVVKMKPKHDPVKPKPTVKRSVSKRKRFVDDILSNVLDDLNVASEKERMMRRRKFLVFYS